MSKITEYLKLIPTAIKNSDKIIDGIVTSVEAEFGKLPEDEIKEIARRRFICAGCPFMSENAKENLALNYKSERTDEHCIQCGCNIFFKTSSLLSNCGLEVWNKNNPYKQIPLKWKAYIKTN